MSGVIYISKDRALKGLSFDIKLNYKYQLSTKKFDKYRQYHPQQYLQCQKLPPHCQKLGTAILMDHKFLNKIIFL